MSHRPNGPEGEHTWSSGKEDENPYGYVPFGGEPSPRPPSRPAKPPERPGRRAPEPPRPRESDDVVRVNLEEDGPSAPSPPPPPSPPPSPPRSSTGAAGKAFALGPMDLVVPENPDESENPYAPASPETKKKAPVAGLTGPSAATVPIPQYRPPARSLVIKETVLDLLPPWPVLALCVVVFFLALGGFAVWPYLTTTMGDNAPPSAQITQPGSTHVTENDRLVLNAGQSRDPEGEALTYQWQYTSPGGEEIIISEVNGARRLRRGTFVTTSEEVLVHFIDPGTVTLILLVNDGVHYSDPAEITFHVDPLPR